MDAIVSSHSWKDFTGRMGELGESRTTEKGRAFEELTRLHLLTDPTFSTKIDEIWHHTDIPQSVVDELGLPRPEIGVDLVARVNDGTYWAIQCKFHQDPARNVTYEELSTFFSITERQNTYSKLSHRLVCTSAHTVSAKVSAAHQEKLAYLTSSEFSQLGQEQFDTFRSVLEGDAPTALTPYEQRDHQVRAVRNCIQYFEDPEKTRGKLIHPCASGKSLTGYWCAEVMSAKTILIAVPSLALVRQTLDTWTREAIANGIDMSWIAVCSDQDVSRSDDPSMQTFDLGIQVDTDSNVIARFLRESKSEKTVLITTYQSGHAVTEGVTKAETVFDLGIFDEAHRTVGHGEKSFSHLLYEG